MGFLQRVLGTGEVRGVDAPVNFPDVWGRALESTLIGTTSGVSVNDDKALTLSAVYGSVRILSEGISKLPVRVTRGKGPDAQPVVQMPGWLEVPAPDRPHIGLGEVLDQVMVSLLLRGNAYLLTPRTESGLITQLHVLNPDDVEPMLRGGRLVFKVEGERQFLTPADVSMVTGLMRPGEICGMSPIDYARETIGLGIAAQQFGGSFFGNGATTSGVLEAPGELSVAGAKLLKNTWEAAHQGSKRAHKVAILTEGLQYKPISVTPEQAQFLDTRRFQVADVARIFGVPPHLLQDASGSTSWGSGLAEQSVNYVTHSLRPWAERINAMLTRMLRSERATVTGQRRPYVTLSLDHLTRGDFATRIATYGSGLDRGIWNLDEVREMEGLPAIPDGSGQQHRVPLNTGPSNTEGDMP